jgi:hypothetical protein
VHNDLLDAQACIDWTCDRLPALEERINSWLKLNVVVEVEDEGPSDVLVAVQRDELPRSLNVEIGACLNTIRSSLDILAGTLAARYNICAPEDAFFPISKKRNRISRSEWQGSAVRIRFAADRTVAARSPEAVPRRK